MADKNILTKARGFTPLIDVLTVRYGVIGAAVFGRIWRYCQLQNDVCQASMERIANDLKLDRRTIMRYVDELVADGYLKDLTPDLRNRPHTYADTGKVYLHATIIAENRDASPEEIDDQVDSGVTLSHSELEEVSSKVTPGVTLSHSGCDTESHRGVTLSHMKIQRDIKIQEKRGVVGATPQEVGEIHKLFQNNFGILVTPIIADAINDAVSTYPVEWIRSAINTAVMNNARSWSYVDAILRRWQKDGFRGGDKSPAADKKKSSNDTLARLEAMREKE